MRPAGERRVRLSESAASGCGVATAAVAATRAGRVGGARRHLGRAVAGDRGDAFVASASGRAGARRPRLGELLAEFGSCAPGWAAARLGDGLAARRHGLVGRRAARQPAPSRARGLRGRGSADAAPAPSRTGVGSTQLGAEPRPAAPGRRGSIKSPARSRLPKDASKSISSSSGPYFVAVPRRPASRLLGAASRARGTCASTARREARDYKARRRARLHGGIAPRRSAPLARRRQGLRQPASAEDGAEISRCAERLGPRLAWVAARRWAAAVVHGGAGGLDARARLRGRPWPVRRDRGARRRSARPRASARGSASVAISVGSGAGAESSGRRPAARWPGGARLAAGRARPWRPGRV